MTRLRASTTKIKSFEYVTRVEFYSDDGVQKGEVEVLAHRPDKLRFEALTPTGDTVAVLISDGKVFSSHTRGDAMCYVGEACAANVSRLLPLAMEGYQVVEVLAGGAPVILHDAAESRWDECEGAYRLTLRRHADKTVQQIWVRPDTFHPIRVKVTQREIELFTLSYFDHVKHKGHWVPQRVTYKSAHRSVDLSLQVRERWLNEVNNHTLFEPRCPGGTIEKALRCQ